MNVGTGGASKQSNGPIRRWRSPLKADHFREMHAVTSRRASSAALPLPQPRRATQWRAAPNVSYRSLELLCRLQARIADSRYGKRSRSADLRERRHRAATSNMTITRPTGNFTSAPLLPARGTVARRNSFDPCRGGRACSAGPMELRIGRSRQVRNSRWTCILSVDDGIVLCCGQRRRAADQRGRR